MLKHLNHDVIKKDGRVAGFTFNLEEFNSAIEKGLKRQTRKRCKETQTDVSNLDPRPPSPSVVDFSKYYNI
jgi:hypothetical protein